YEDGRRLKDNADGLRVSIGADASFKLGEFNDIRPTDDTLFSFYIQEAGVYPLRCVYDEIGGGAAVEWFSVTKDGKKVLLNDGTDADALKCYRSRTWTPPERPTIGVSMEGGQVTIEFTGTLQSADEVTGPWTDVPDATSPYTVAPEGPRKFYRAKK
ncbi:MAG: hypothetical protein J7M29_05440, partial [Verrucomicrobia bacterium]|nr:hypothetical protein [Verrucomicrobiota bacterium]